MQAASNMTTVLNGMSNAFGAATASIEYLTALGIISLVATEVIMKLLDHAKSNGNNVQKAS